MTNMEYYREQIKAIVDNGSGIAIAKESGKLQACRKTGCNNCVFRGGESACISRLVLWLMAEHKDEPMLTQRDYHLVQFLPDGWVSRDKVGMLNWYANKPIQNDAFWVAVNDISIKHGIIIGFGNSILPFIRWEDKEPWSVADLRKLRVREEVQEDDC